jgi:hypothetical protein
LEGPCRNRRQFAPCRAHCPYMWLPTRATCCAGRRLPTSIRCAIGTSRKRPLLAEGRGSPWRPIAAVEKSGSCRDGQLTGAAANSHYRPTPAVDAFKMKRLEWPVSKWSGHSARSPARGWNLHCRRSRTGDASQHEKSLQRPQSSESYSRVRPVVVVWRNRKRTLKPSEAVVRLATAGLVTRIRQAAGNCNGCRQSLQLPLQRASEMRIGIHGFRHKVVPGCREAL